MNWPRSQNRQADGNTYFWIEIHQKNLIYKISRRLEVWPRICDLNLSAVTYYIVPIMLDNGQADEKSYSKVHTYGRYLGVSW